MQDFAKKAAQVVKLYKEQYSTLEYNRDYLPLKITEEWGECLKEYLMISGKGRDKGFSPEEMRKNFEQEFADVMGYLLAFAEQENIDIEKALEEKWFKYLDK